MNVPRSIWPELIHQVSPSLPVRMLAVRCSRRPWLREADELRADFLPLSRSSGENDRERGVPPYRGCIAIEFCNVVEVIESVTAFGGVLRAGRQSTALPDLRLIAPPTMGSRSRSWTSMGT